MRRPSLSVVPVVAVAVLGLAGLTAPLASASPTADAPKSRPAPAAPGTGSAKLPTVSADKALTGFTTVTSDLKTDFAGAQTFADVTCPTGTRVVGGGAVVSSSSLAENINSSFPLLDKRTWRAYVNNTGTVDGTFKVYANCVTKVGQYQIVDGTPVDNPAGSQSRATVACPTGTVPIGGGGSNSSSATTVGLNSSFPTATGWTVDTNNASAGGDSAVARVICGVAPSKYKLVSTTPQVTADPGTQTRASVSCGSLNALSGGMYSNSGSTAAALNSTGPSGAITWVSYVNNGSGTASTVAAYAVCAKVIA